MAAALAVTFPELRMTEGEYLRSEFEPAAEFVDGVIEERPMGEFDHSTWQEALQAWFRAHYPEWNLRARPELRVHVSPTRYRIPDVTVMSMDAPVEQVLVTPPVAVFEVLSPDDTVRRMLVKLADYERMGIRNIFVIDPDGPVFFQFRDGKLGPAEGKTDLQGSAGVVDWKAIQELFY